MLATCHRFELELDMEIADVLEPFEGGVAVINTRFPELWSASYLLLEPGAATGADRIEQLLAEHLASRAIRHGAVRTVEAEENGRLAENLTARGWDRDRTLYMVAGRPPDREPDATVEEVGGDAIAALRGELAREERESASVQEQLLGRDRMLDAVASGRWFAAMHEDAPGSCCVLLSRGGVGQIETVITAPAARNRGLARAVVLAAREASRLAGNELTFVAADADDWAERLYRRLGFDPVGVSTGLIRKPPSQTGGDILPA